MAETFGVGNYGSGAGGTGWVPSGTPHYSKYYSYGFYRSRAFPRSMAWAYLLGALVAVPLSMGAVGLTTRTPMSTKVASRWSGKEFSRGFVAESVPFAGSVWNVAAISRLSGRAAASRAAGAVTGQVVWTAAYAYAAKTIASRDWTPGTQPTSDVRGAPRRRRFEYEYAYKF